MGLVSEKDGWQMPDEIWEEIKRLLPPRKPHPLGCHNPRVPDRKAMEAILFILRTGCQWNALNMTGICSSSSAHRRFQEWSRAGVFRKLWKRGLLRYDKTKGLDWRWTAMDGAMTKAPLGGKKYRSQSDRSGQRGDKEKFAGRGKGDSRGVGRQRSQSA